MIGIGESSYVTVILLMHLLFLSILGLTPSGGLLPPPSSSGGARPIIPPPGSSRGQQQVQGGSDTKTEEWGDFTSFG